MDKPVEISDIRIITISGRIASGSTTLAKHLAKHLNWKHLEGGEIFWEAVRKKLGLSEKDTNLRPDEEDQLFDLGRCSEPPMIAVRYTCQNGAL